MKNSFSFLQISIKNFKIKFYKTLDAKNMDFPYMLNVLLYLISIQIFQNVTLGDILQA